MAGRLGPPSPDPRSAIIYDRGVVHTLEPSLPRAHGLRIEAGVITHVWEGSPPEGLTGRKVDLDGAVVLPGLVDAHIHLRGLGQAARQLDLRRCSSPADVATKVGAAAARLPRGTWIEGRGWDQTAWDPPALPGHEVLDAAAPDHPVMLTRVDGHASWVNARAIEHAGIDARTPSPPGGDILRNERGAPSGVLVDNAMDLVRLAIPEPTASDVRADLLEALDRCRRAGLTAVHDMGTTAEVLEQLRRLEREGELTLRVYAYLGGPWEDVAPQLARPPDRDGLVRVVGVKLFADGALGSWGGALLEPYADRQDTRGLLLTAPDELAERVRAVHRAGHQVAVHAIGDRANRIALDAIAAAQGEDGPHRHRIEHAQVLHPDDVARFHELGVVASMQPVHATSDMRWASTRLGDERVRGSYAWRTLLDADARLAFGSDAPVEHENPWHGIHAAVTSQDLRGEPGDGWRPDQRLTVRAAILGFTRWAADVVGALDTGAIRPGAIADLTVVDRDPFEIAAADLAGAGTLRTLVAGREVYKTKS